MRRLGRWLGRLLVAVGVLVAVAVVLPREMVERSPIAADLADPEAYLATREAAFDDIIPGTEARIIWAGEDGARTDLVLLYLHGFSATSEEIRPVPDLVAEGLGANLVYARLPGHGRDGDAMAEPRAGDWVDDATAMLQVARAVGERVVIIGTSTGGTLAAYAATDADMAADIAGIIFVSPNFELANPAGAMLEWPLARVWLPLVAGRERSFEPVNEDHAAFWTEAYPTVATVTLGTLMRETRGRDVTATDIPALFLFSDADQVVSAAATRAVAERWGGAVTLAPQDLPAEGADPFNHVIAGDILSPAMTEPIADLMTDWIIATLP